MSSLDIVITTQLVDIALASPLALFEEAIKILAHISRKTYSPENKISSAVLNLLMVGSGIAD